MSLSQGGEAEAGLTGLTGRSWFSGHLAGELAGFGGIYLQSNLPLWS